MRKIILFNFITLDGYFEGPNGEIDWHHIDPAFELFAAEQLRSADTLLFGRKTYELMKAYWPTASAMAKDPEIAELMNNMPKIVFSKTLDKAGWNNTRLVKDNAAEEIRQLKKQPGKDMLVFGSANLSSTLMQHGLIDEFRIMINPLIIGRGNPLFTNIVSPYKLVLIKTRVFDSGNVLLYYKKCYEL